MASFHSAIRSRVVGALACQRDSYRRTIETEVISCVKHEPSKASQKANSTSAQSQKAEPSSAGLKFWLIEFADSVLFPEGGGQPTDHGTVSSLTAPSSEPIAITLVQRHGLRCVYYSPQPLPVGTSVRQEVDFKRRWDHMQQHTGQHLLSAVMGNLYNLETLGWGMGAENEMNYVEVPRKVAVDELRAIQTKCNEAIRDNLNIVVETPDDAKADSLPTDYDKDKGVVRVVKIGNLDNNTCCGTHLSQTSHLSVILLHFTQPVRSTNCRIYFTVGERAINLSTATIDSNRSIAQIVSSGMGPTEVLANVKKLSENAADAKKKERRLLADIAKYEGERVKAALQAGKNAWVYRADEGLEFINMVVSEIKEVAKEGGVVVLAAGEGKKGGPVVIFGEKNAVESFAGKIKEVVTEIKGGGRGERWQGKVTSWGKGELERLRELVET